jgi:hypothetical protein
LREEFGAQVPFARDPLVGGEAWGRDREGAEGFLCKQPAMHPSEWIAEIISGRAIGKTHDITALGRCELVETERWFDPIGKTGVIKKYLEGHELTLISKSQERGVGAVVFYIADQYRGECVPFDRRCLRWVSDPAEVLRCRQYLMLKRGGGFPRISLFPQIQMAKTPIRSAH